VDAQPTSSAAVTESALANKDWLLGEKLDIVDDRSNDWIEREGPDGKKFRVFDHENFRRSKRQIGALQWRISKLTPKRYHWMRWGPLRMP
jgi:hypothetical protein